MTRISLRQGAPGARILGLGGYRPRRRVTNADLEQVMDTTVDVAHMQPVLYAIESFEQIYEATQQAEAQLR